MNQLFKFALLLVVASIAFGQTCEDETGKFDVTLKNGKTLRKGCPWVRRNIWHCKIDDVRAHCGASCGGCTPTASPTEDPNATEAPSPAPTAPPSEDPCKDSRGRVEWVLANGKTFYKTCRWITKNRWHCNNFANVRDFCPLGCEVCSPAPSA